MLAEQVDGADLIAALAADSNEGREALSQAPPIGRDAFRRWFVTSHALALAVLKDPRFSSDSRNAAVVDAAVECSAAFGGSEMPLRPYLFFDPPVYLAGRPFLFLDPPDHTRLRRLVSRAFTPKVIADLAPSIEAILDQLVPAELDGFELMDGLAYPLPLRVIMEMLGIPAEHEPVIREWTPRLVGMLNADGLRTGEERDAARIAQFTLAPIFVEQVEERRNSPRDDLLTALVESEDDGDTLTSFEVVATGLLLLLAGHETTANLLGNAVWQLLQDRTQLEAVAAEPELAAAAVDETLRYLPPVQLIARTATEDVEVGGAQVTAGDHLLLLLAAAGRDESRFVDPHRFDLRRADRGGHLGFGFGLHHCLGAPLARLETEAALRRLAPALVRSYFDGEVTWRRDPVIRGPEVLRLQRLQPGETL